MKQRGAIALCRDAVLTLALLLALGSCGKTSFTSGSIAKTLTGERDKKDPPADGGPTEPPDDKGDINTGNTEDNSGGNNTPAPTPKPKIAIDLLKDDDFTMADGADMLAATRESRFWVVSGYGLTTSHIYYFVMRDRKLIPTEGKAKKEWTFNTLPNQTGMRTYVTEKGLVFASRGGYLMWVDPESTPEGPIDVSANSSNFYTFPNAVDGIANYVKPDPSWRMCVVSYRRGPNRFIGVGYGPGHFAEMKMDATPPYAPKFAVTRFVNGTGSGIALWGYSCYIDQNRLIYYGRQNNLGALNLNTMTHITPATSQAPNGNANLYADATVRGAITGTSYVLAGDIQGNLFGAGAQGSGNYYTFAHDPASNYVFAFGYNTKTMQIFPHECLSTKTDCSLAAATYQFDYSNSSVNNSFQGTLGTIGPVSALKAGGIIAVTRWGGRQVLYITMTDPSDPTKGIDITKLADNIQGDPYMYTDFTGATLYNIAGDVRTFNFKDIAGFSADKNVRYVAISWKAAVGKSTAWSSALLEARCYKGDSGEGTDFEGVPGIKDAGSKTFLAVTSCRDQAVDHIDLRISQGAGATTSANVETIYAGFYQ